MFRYLDIQAESTLPNGWGAQHHMQDTTSKEQGLAGDVTSGQEESLG